MIKLELPSKPAELTEEKEEELVTQFKADKLDPVWQKKYIKEAVFKIAFGKCAYSEVQLKEEGKDMQIDHFLPKTLYEDDVVRWGNLLPSLNHCNRTKGKIDPNATPLVNPLYDNPKEHFYFIAGLLYYKTSKGNNSISKFGLNNQSKLFVPRFRLLNELSISLKDIEPWKEKDIDYFVTRLKELMGKGSRKKAYSAACATFILSNKHFSKYKTCLQLNKLWDTEFQELEKELEFCSLPK